MIAEELILQTTAFSAFVLSVLLVLSVHAVTRSKAFRAFFVSPQAVYRISHWLGFIWAAGLGFHFLEFSTGLVFNHTLLVGNLIAGKTVAIYFTIFLASAFIFLYARHAFKQHYAREIQRAPSLEHARGGFRGLSANDVEVLRSIKEEKGDLRKIIFDTGWLDEEEVLAALKKLGMLGLVRVREGKVYVTPEGGDVLVYPLTLFSSGVDRQTLKEMTEARDALAKGDKLHVISACARVLERNLKEQIILKSVSAAEADKIFGKPLARATLGDLIGFVRDREKDFFLGGMLTTINEARKALHDGRQCSEEEAAYTYLLTEIAVKYLHSARAARTSAA